MRSSYTLPEEAASFSYRSVQDMVDGVKRRLPEGHRLLISDPQMLATNFIAYMRQAHGLNAPNFQFKFVDESDRGACERVLAQVKPNWSDMTPKERHEAYFGAFGNAKGSCYAIAYPEAGWVIGLRPLRLTLSSFNIEDRILGGFVLAHECWHMARSSPTETRHFYFSEGSADLYATVVMEAVVDGEVDVNFYGRCGPAVDYLASVVEGQLGISALEWLRESRAVPNQQIWLRQTLQRLGCTPSQEAAIMGLQPAFPFLISVPDQYATWYASVVEAFGGE